MSRGGERCAIVGSGLAALAGYAALRRGGLRPEEIVVFGTHDDPTEVWRMRAASIRQRRMRSESDGHLAAAAFPGLAVREAVRRGTPAPLVASIANRYHPSVAAFLAHANALRARSGWERSFRSRRIDRIVPVDGGFELGGGTFAHVLVATGHPALAKPAAFANAVHAYEPHEYASSVAVVGAGMAAATEWLNALAAGAKVVSIRRREPLRRPLNVPRPLFSKRGLAAFHAATNERKAVLLRELSTPSYPPGPEWDEPIRAGERSSQFRVADTSPTHVSPNGWAEQVICATGFTRGFRNDPLLAHLVEEHGLATHDRWIVLALDSTVPDLTDDSRTLSVAGVAAQWAFPAADTIAGAKYAARAFLRRVCRTR
jgi:cation diffusion facilitator CzcD-associated flavoprotein CzcO